VPRASTAHALTGHEWGKVAGWQRRHVDRGRRPHGRGRYATAGCLLYIYVCVCTHVHSCVYMGKGIMREVPYAAAECVSFWCACVRVDIMEW
jgi:hypothetical protein